MTSSKKMPPNLLNDCLKQMSDYIYNYTFNEKSIETLKSLSKSIKSNPEHMRQSWEDGTPYEKCKWFVSYDNGDEEFLRYFGTKKKALMYMKTVKDYFPTLIKGGVVKW